MLLIWGFKVRFKTIDNGVFYCATCGGDRQYGRQQGRRWFTLFFIPLIPLKVIGDEFVECQTCTTAFRPSVLELPTTAALGDLLLAATREALVWVMRAEGSPPSPAALTAAVEVLSATAGQPWAEANVHSDLAGIDVSGLPSRLATLAGILNEQGKERFLEGCVRVAATGGLVTPAAREVLDSIAGALSMTAAHARGVIAETVDQREP